MDEKLKGEAEGLRILLINLLPHVPQEVARKAFANAVNVSQRLSGEPQRSGAQQALREMERLIRR